MLVLGRKIDECIDVLTPSGERIAITVLEWRGDNVRLGIEADRSVIVHRREVALEIERKQQQRETA